VSHIATIEAELRDIAAIRAAQRRLGWAVCIEKETVLMFDRNEVTGWAIRAPDWTYPIVATADGSLHYDNFGGRWGDPKHLDALKQAYAVEKAKLEARRRGHSVREKVQADGTVKLTIQVQGGAA